MANSIVLTEADIFGLLNSPEQFPVSFDIAWQWIGYSSKQSAKKKLVNNFLRGVDYSLMQTDVNTATQGIEAGRPSENIRLTVDAFKSLGMMAGTAKGREIRQYFLDCERKFRESQELNSQYRDKIRELELTLQVEQLRNQREARREAIVTIHPPHMAALILGAEIVEKKEVIQQTVMVDSNTMQPVATFDGVGITYLQKRYGFKDTKQTWQALESIGYGKDTWVQEMGAVMSAKLPRERLAELDKKLKNATRQRFIGE